MEKISFKVGSSTLRGYLYRPEKLQDKNPAILFIHGWTSTSTRDRYVRFTKTLSKLGYICMGFDMRGHGISDGELNTQTGQDFLEDVVGAYDYLATRDRVDSDKIHVVGSSFGGYLAVLLSTLRPLQSLVLRAPANYPDETFSKPQVDVSSKPETVTWRTKHLAVSSNKALVAIRAYKGHLLVVESEIDDLVPQQTLLNYLHAFRDKKRLAHVVIKGATHSIPEPASIAKFERILVNWFKPRV